MGNDCTTTYPVILLHGLAYRDDMACVASWGRIPARLQAAGCSVYLGELEAWSSIETNATMLCQRVCTVLASTGASKVNLIGHSKGGLEARYAVSVLGLADRVASVTTICTPHHGTYMADVAVALTPSDLMPQSVALGFLARLMGDRHPQGVACLRELSRGAMARFNRAVPDSPAVYYQSFGTAMKRVADDPLFALSYKILQLHDGENDGMVTADSCQWTNFRGIIPTKNQGEGISHLEITDFRKKDVAGVDIPSVYVDIVRDLKGRGY
jgi:triacylglycerol lipase